MVADLVAIEEQDAVAEDSQVAEAVEAAEAAEAAEVADLFDAMVVVVETAEVVKLMLSEPEKVAQFAGGVD